VREDFIRFHKVRPGWIGVLVKDSAPPVSGSTALVEGTIPGAPGEKAGLQPGDVLLQVGTHRITSLEDVLDASFFLSAEDETLLRVAREGSEREFRITPIDHPELSRPRLQDLSRPRLPVLGSTGETSVPMLPDR